LQQCFFVFFKFVPDTAAPRRGEMEKVPVCLFPQTNNALAWQEIYFGTDEEKIFSCLVSQLKKNTFFTHKATRDGVRSQRVCGPLC